MNENTLSVRLKHAAKTEAEWKASNPVLLKGEIAYSTDKRQSKTGDGTSKWTELAYDSAVPIDHEHDLSEMINNLATATAIPANEDYYVCQYAGGGTTNTNYYRRPMSALWEYIKRKLKTVAITGSYNDLSNKPGVASSSADGFMTADMYKQISTYFAGDIDLDGGRATSASSDYANDFNGGGA